MSDRPDLDEAINILQSGGFKITGGKYAPPKESPKMTSIDGKEALDDKLKKILTAWWDSKDSQASDNRAVAQIREAFEPLISESKGAHFKWEHLDLTLKAHLAAYQDKLVSDLEKAAIKVDNSAPENGKEE